jgi:hypothetical protein
MKTKQVTKEYEHVHSVNERTDHHTEKWSTDLKRTGNDRLTKTAVP